MSRPRALENVRVVDFSWVRAGPWPTRWLGALGAEIIKIEWPENERGTATADVILETFYPGEAAIYNGSPWRISQRAPLIGEHNTQIFCDELGLSRGERCVLGANRVI